jgi:predicted CoA-binding protein
MPTLRQAVEEFLAQTRLAIVGVSRNGSEAANIVYRKVRGAGYQVYPVNPNASEVEGDACYPDLKSIPGGVTAVVIATHPAVTDQVVRECAALGITRVWMHRSFGKGSVSEAAAQFCREHGMTVIAGGCPMMFCPPVDFGHRCMRWVLTLSGGLPRRV